MGLTAACHEGDELEIDIRSGSIRNHARGVTPSAQPYTQEMLTILESGGLLELLAQRVAAEERA